MMQAVSVYMHNINMRDCSFRNHDLEKCHYFLYKIGCFNALSDTKTGNISFVVSHSFSYFPLTYDIALLFLDAQIDNDTIQSSITALQVNTSKSMVQIPFNVYSQGNYLTGVHLNFLILKNLVHILALRTNFPFSLPR